jgi:copper oxidase (laccase) domain-containing protein
VTHRDGRLHFDLAAANLRFLVECGVPRDAVETADLCTYDHPGLLHSYRRDGPGGGHHGLCAAIA